jgi:hypothetical protein
MIAARPLTAAAPRRAKRGAVVGFALHERPARISDEIRLARRRDDEHGVTLTKDGPDLLDSHLRIGAMNRRRRSTLASAGPAESTKTRTSSLECG